MFSEDVNKAGFTVVDAAAPEEDPSVDMIRIVGKRYEEDSLRLECCDHDKK